MSDIEAELRKAEASIAGYTEFMKATEVLLNGIAEDVRSMEDGPEKTLLYAFIRKHTIPYGKQIHFLRSLYNPQSGGEEG